MKSCINSESQVIPLNPRVYLTRSVQNLRYRLICLFPSRRHEFSYPSHVHFVNTFLISTGARLCARVRGHGAGPQHFEVRVTAQPETQAKCIQLPCVTLLLVRRVQLIDFYRKSNIT